MGTQQERRKYKRYAAKAGAYAIISPGLTRLGQIIDISKAGLAFKYIDSNPDIKDKNETLFLSSMGYYVKDIEFKTISDYEVSDYKSPKVGPDAMRIRKRHINFIDLNFKQLFDLDYYIENNISQAIHYSFC
jgi:hypothetical protein